MCTPGSEVSHCIVLHRLTDLWSSLVVTCEVEAQTCKTPSSLALLRMKQSSVNVTAHAVMHMQTTVAAHEHPAVPFMRLRACRNTKLPWMMDPSVSSRHVSRLSWWDANSEFDCTLTSCARMPELAGADMRSASSHAQGFEHAEQAYRCTSYAG